MKPAKQWSVLILAFALLLGACHSKQDNSYLMSNMSGKVNEVIVVINQQKWEGQIGDTLFAKLTQEYEGLPQSEPYFDVDNVKPASFYSLESLKTFRNLVLIEVESSNTKASHTVQKGLWAKQQLVIKIKAPNDAALLEYIQLYGDRIRETITQAEAERIATNYNQYANIELMQTIEAKYGANLTVPKNFSIGQQYENFIWLAHETPELSQGIFIYSYPYTSEKQFSKDSLISRRNQFVGKYVPGTIKGSFMTTDSLTPISYKAITLRETYATELRGLWFTKGDFMGGPFVSISKVDEAHGRIVTAEGFVYAPKHKKRNYVQQVEEIIKTLRFPKNEK